ncbi:MAG: hypothetical protein EHM81_02355 [Chloroflexi bacterium]|nr:MAG: hypothetical protein EHM81_02355 [Chloroflexota bacterium]
MKFNRVLLFMLIAILGLLLSACGTAPATNWPGMTTDGANVYLASGSHVYVVQLSDGREIATQTTEGPIPLRFPTKADASVSFFAAPALTADGQVIVGNAVHSSSLMVAKSNSLLYSFDQTAGNVRWSFGEAKGTWMASALVNGDTIYAPAGDGKLYAFDLKGQKRWESAVSEHALWSAPVTDGKQVFIATLEHEIIALDAQTGAQKWKTDLDNAVLGAPAVAGGTLYVGTLSGNLYALDSAGGKQKWVAALQGSIWGTPAISGETLYIGTAVAKAGKFYAVNITNGKPIQSRDEASAIIASPLVLPDQVVYATEAGHIQSLNLDGTPKWQADLEKGQFYTAPSLAGDLILFAPMQSEFLLLAYDQNGAQKWTFVPGK